MTFSIKDTGTVQYNPAAATWAHRNAAAGFDGIGWTNLTSSAPQGILYFSTFPPLHTSPAILSGSQAA